MMTDPSQYDSLAAHLSDLQERSQKWHKPLSSMFLTEEEQAAMQRLFPESDTLRYDGGYPNARNKKVIFLYDQEDDFSDVVCLEAETDQRFRKIGHRDVLGALMHLQIDRHTFGDFWVEENRIYLYTSEQMAPFLMDHLTRIGQLSVSFHICEKHPEQTFHTKRLEIIMASERLDAAVAGITHCSRSEAKEMIRRGLVQLNHSVVEEPDELCNNNVVISIRKVGRFQYVGPVRRTRNGRLVGEFLQYV